ncbi:ATP-dependent metallopeptidase FtsH/Yme1/Tma family protein [Thermoflexus sp.]|uniref:ATP-dependent metallopeptidase FtsH/Yme1/Tma family protein n=1 Tax=Thermoflexus sp. TaxID=1969742 RepID=UPI00260590A0|nr:ATP-dependent metallopeptidase FtsH/Yme1/Tma family protein [Thermoflexus sp.]
MNSVRLRNGLIWLLIAITLIVFLAMGRGGGSRGESVSLTDIAARLEAGEVKKVVVSGDYIQVELRNGKILTAVKESGSTFLDQMKALGVPEDKLRSIQYVPERPNEWGSILIAFLTYGLPALVVVGFLYFILRQAQAPGNQAFNFSKSRARMFTGERPTVTFDDVAGVDEAKQELQEVVEFLKEPEKFIALGARIPKGVLLVGPPGTGKTLLAKAVSGEAGVPFFSISGSEFVEMFVGVGAARVRDLFEQAKRHSPCIVFIDEIDAVGRYRGAGIGGSHDEREQTLNQILVEMDGFDTDTNVIVMAASVTGDTPILIKERDGRVRLLPIAEVVDRYYAPGEEGVEKPADFMALGLVPRHDPRGNHALLFGHSAFVPVRGVFRHRVNEIYEIEFAGGTIRATGNHSVFVRTRQGLVTKAVAELQPGDVLVALPYKVNRTSRARAVRAHRFPQAFSMELPLYEEPEEIRAAYEWAVAAPLPQAAVAAALGVSQTTISKWRRGLHLPRSLSRVTSRHALPEKVPVTPELCRLLGYFAADGYSRKEVVFSLGADEHEEIEDIRRLMREIFGLEPDRIREEPGRAIHLVYHSKPLADFFARHVGRTAWNKHVPAFLFEAPFEYFVEFLRGYARGDGYIDARGKLEITSVNHQLILELHWLCRMHGLNSHVSTFRVRAGRRIAGGKPLPATRAYRLGLGRWDNPLLPGWQRENSRAHLPVVRSVRRIPYDGYVYDLCGCQYEAFFGGETPILLHNTNRPDILDPALLRPGRFDRRVILDRPDVKGREAIFRVHLRGKPLDDDVDVSVLARATPGFVGADIANVVNEAAILAARKNKKKISMKDFEEAIEKVIAGPERKSRIITEREKRIIAYHEAGHAVVAYYLPNCDPVHKVTIIPRGMAGGYTLALPQEDRTLWTRSKFLDDMAMALGGRAAEEIVFGDITTGAAEDLERVTELARAMVTRYGMSEKLGPMVFGKKEELIFLGKEIAEQRDYSDAVAQEIDAEVRRLVMEAYERAKRILTEHRDKLEAVAQKLIEMETLDAETFRAIMEGRLPPEPKAPEAPGPSPQPAAPQPSAPTPGTGPAPVPVPA